MEDPVPFADYRRPDVLLALACAGLGVMALLDLIYIPAGIIGIQGLGGFNGGVRDQDLVDLSTLLRGLSGLAQVAMLIVLAIVFCMLMFRCAENARAFGFHNFNHSPGWCVGWFFVPFAHLWMPFKANGEVWQSSRSPIQPGEHPEWWHKPVGPLFSLWWAAWIIGTISNNTASRLSRSSTLELAGMWLIPFAAVIQISAALLAIIVVIKLVKNQHAQAQTIRAATAEPPQGSPQDV